MTARAPDGWPAPLAPIAYTGIVGEIVRAIAPETEADPAAILVQMLTMFGSVVGRTAHFRVGADVHHLNLFAAVVGDTAKGRKGVSHGQASHIWEAVDPDWARSCRASGLSSGEGLIWAIRDAIERQQPVKEHGRVVDYQTVTEDPGIADKRLLITESELASTLKVMAREGNTLSPIIRQAWDGHDLRTLTKTSAARATAPHVGIIAMITRDELRRLLSVTEAANGFGNRFLWVCARRSKELPDGGRPVDLAWALPRVRQAVAHARQVGELRRDDAAGARWRNIYGRLSAGRPGLLGAMTARAEAQVMRLACLYAVGDFSYFVAREHLAAALEVWRYGFASARYVFGDRLGDATADEIQRALQAEWPASLTRSEISGLFGRNKPAGEISRALQLLADCHLAVREDDDHAGKGRPAERWHATMNEKNEFDEITPGAEGDLSSLSFLSLPDESASEPVAPATTRGAV